MLERRGEPVAAGFEPKIESRKIMAMRNMAARAREAGSFQFVLAATAGMGASGSVMTSQVAIKR